MKGFVFRFGRRSTHELRLPPLRISKSGIRDAVKKYLPSLIFWAIVFTGLILGAAYAQNADEALISRLDLLFTTNLDARAKMAPFELFLSCLASYILFTLPVFSFGMSVWGMGAIPFAVCFKGFSVGLSAAVIFAKYHISGLGFFILVLLPGTVVYLLMLSGYAKESFLLSFGYLRLTVFGASREVYLTGQIKSYMIRSLIAAAFSLGAALLDMLLWMLFAHLFRFI